MVAIMKLADGVDVPATPQNIAKVLAANPNEAPMIFGMLLKASVDITRTATDWLNGRIQRRDGETEVVAYTKSFYGMNARDQIGRQVVNLLHEFEQGELARGVAKIEAETVAKSAPKPVAVPDKGEAHRKAADDLRKTNPKLTRSQALAQTYRDFK